MIARGTIIVDVEGAKAGQVNGLAVLQFGDYHFARPSRITARTFLGQRGVVSIDRESQLSGKIHDKGVLILGGFLGWRYGQDKPLSLSATISFEQGYDLVDGDSASLAETCAIVSALAEVPLRQDLAITGSVNQNGEVQPIGAVNAKIEGFHDICRVSGFSGQQGVIIPARNRRNLMLRDDVVRSVADGAFSVYEVSTVDDALELLTGLPAGERDAEGKFGEGSVNFLADQRLRRMGEAMRQFGRRQRENNQQAEEEKKEEAPKEPEEPEKQPPEPEPGLPE
jgi:predicted ATP-dependent protease